MGILGLTTFINNNPHLTDEFRLCNTKIVIDGNSLYHFLYYKTKLDLLYGGDYDQYALKIREFFSLLHSCNIQPYVVFDGGNEPNDKKFQTLLNRIERRLEMAIQLTIQQRDYCRVMPIMARDTFNAVLLEIKIPFVVCDFEADKEIAKLANQFNCPVLSDDSDFYIFTLASGFVRFDSLDLTLQENRMANGGLKNIPARRYHVDNFVKFFPSLGKGVFPLLAALLGNDYADKTVFKSFCFSIRSFEGSRTQFRDPTDDKRILKIVLWLQSLKTYKEGIEKIMSQSQNKDAISLAIKITEEAFMLNATDTEFSLSSYFMEKGNTASNPIRGHYGSMIPAWYVCQHRQGIIPPTCMDIITLHRQLLIPQQKENIVSVKTPKLTNQRVKELKTAERETTPRNSSRRESLNESSGSLDLEKSFHPRFDFSDVLKNLETPEGQKGKQRKLGKRKSSLPFDELFEVAIHAAAKFTTDYKASETADEVDGVCDSANEDTERPLKGVVIYVSKKLSGQQAELNDLVAELGGDYKWQYDASCTHFVFQGKTNDTTKEFRVAREQKKIIVSPLWIRLCKEQNVRVDESLFPHTYNPNMTLSMVKKATPGRSSPVKSVSRRNTPQRGTRRSTRASKQSESSDIDDVQNDSPVTKATDHKSTENKSAKRGRNFSPEPDSKRQRVSSGNESVSDDKETDKQEAEFVEMGGTLDYREELAKQLKEDMAGAKTKRPQGRRKSRKLNSSGQMNMSGEGSSNDSGLQSRPGSRTNRWSMNEEQKEAQKASEVPPKEGSLPESSQTVHVMWDDPTGRLEQERLAHKLQRACSPTQDPGMAPEVMDAQFSDIEDENILPQLSENETEKRLSSPLAAPPVAFHKQSEQSVPTPQPVTIEEEEEGPEPTPPIFILSGMSQEERDDYGVLVESLGGKMLDGQNFDPTCTHLVIGVPARNEKFLACVASGKWVLHKSYFEACRQEGKFVQEDFYEWGGEGTVSLLDKMNPAIKKLCEAAHRWRIQINSSSQSCVGAFSEWKVILCTDRKKEDNFRRLLEAGGATVLNLKPPFNKSVSASHAFVELNKVEMSESDLVTLVKSGVVCVKPDFIAAHLTNSPAPNPEDYCPSEVKTLLQSLSGKRKTSSSDDSRKRSRR